MVNESIPLSVSDLMSLPIRGLEAMSEASIPEVHLGALESTLSPGST